MGSVLAERTSRGPACQQSDASRRGAYVKAGTASPTRPEVKVASPAEPAVAAFMPPHQAAASTQPQSAGTMAIAQVLEHVDHGIAVFDADLILRFCNRRFVERLVLPPELLSVGRTALPEMLVHMARRGDYGPGDPQAITEAILAKIRKGPHARFECLKPNGIWLQGDWNRLPDGGFVTVLTDVTALKKAEAAARESRDDAMRARTQLVTAIESISEGFVLWDADDRLVAFNSRYRDEYSFAPEQLRPGISFEELLRAGVARGVVPVGYDPEQWLQERLRQHRNPQAPYVVERPDGRSVLITEYRTSDGGIVGIRTDVTQLRLREQAAQEARQRLVEAIEAIPQGFAIFDPEDRLVLFNQRYKDKYSLAPDFIRPGVSYEELLHEIVRRGLVDVPPERREAWIRERIALHRAGKRNLITNRWGRWVSIEECRTESGHVVVIHTDITDLVQREQEAKRNRQLLRDVIDAVPAVINVKDRQSRYVLMNKFQGKVYGVDPDRAIGRTSDDFVGPHYGGYSNAMDQIVIRTGKPLPWCEREFAGKDGRPYIWLSTKVPLKNEAGETENVLTVALDMTDLKATQRARSNLARYLPPNLIEVLASEDEPFGPPRLQNIGILFVDMIGFTRIAATYPPETVFALLREFQSRLAKVVLACGGTLDEFTGDGLMATFGTPYGTGRDAANALECARRIAHEVRELWKERRQRGEPAVEARVGVHWGAALVGNIGDESRLKFSVVGDTVNVASRLERLTRKLDVVVAASESVVSQAGREGARTDDFVWRGKHRLRGRKMPISVWGLKFDEGLSSQRRAACGR